MDPKEEQWADEIPDDELDCPDYEPAYKDGSAKNECKAEGQDDCQR